MTTATLEQPPEQTEQTEQPPEQTEAMVADAAMVADLEQVERLGGRERGFMTRVRLDVGKLAEHRMYENCQHFANSPDEEPNIRSQTAKLFAMKFSKASGTSTDDKEIYRMVKAYALAGLVSHRVGAKIPKLPWSTLRVLTRWVDWDQTANTFTAQFSVDVGIKDEDGRTTRDIDAAEILETLIPALIASPLDKGKLVKVLDKREASAREAQLEFLTDKERKHSAAAKAMADRIQASKERKALFASFAQKVVNAKLTADEIFQGLLDSDLIPRNADAKELDTSTLTEASADHASMIGKLWVQANNTDAIFALYRVIKPLVAKAAAMQPNKTAGASLNETETPNHDPIGSSRNMHPMSKTG